MIHYNFTAVLQYLLHQLAISCKRVELFNEKDVEWLDVVVLHMPGREHESAFSFAAW